MDRINELNQKLNNLTEAAEPKSANGNFQKGKTYVAWYVSYEPHQFYLIPNGTKMSDFEEGGKFFSWATQHGYGSDDEGPDFIMTVKDVS